MFNFSVENIIIETIIYILISLIVKVMLAGDDFVAIRRILLLGYLVFASLFISLTIFIIVSVCVVLLTIFIRKALDY